MEPADGRAGPPRQAKSYCPGRRAKPDVPFKKAHGQTTAEESPFLWRSYALTDY